MNAHYIFKFHTTTWNQGTEEKKRSEERKQFKLKF